MFKAISETEHTMGVWCPTHLLHKIKEMLEGSKCGTTFHTVFKAACRWTGLKVSEHLDPWMFAIPNKIASYWWGTSLQFMLSYIHTSSRVCYQLSCKSETLCTAAERQTYRGLVTFIRNELLSNPQVLPMIDTASWFLIYVLPWYQLSQFQIQFSFKSVYCYMYQLVQENTSTMFQNTFLN